MPHCILEYSDDLELKEKKPLTLQMITEAMANTGIFNKKNIKIIALPVSMYLLGGERVPFIHTSVRIKSGRTDEQKSIIGQAIINTISKQYPSLEKISVEVVDMSPNVYSKKV